MVGLPAQHLASARHDYVALPTRKPRMSDGDTIARSQCSTAIPFEHHRLARRRRQQPRAVEPHHVDERVVRKVPQPPSVEHLQPCGRRQRDLRAVRRHLSVARRWRPAQHAWPGTGVTQVHLHHPLPLHPNHAGGVTTRGEPLDGSTAGGPFDVAPLPVQQADARLLLAAPQRHHAERTRLDPFDRSRQLAQQLRGARPFGFRDHDAFAVVHGHHASLARKAQIADRPHVERTLVPFAVAHAKAATGAARVSEPATRPIGQKAPLAGDAQSLGGGVAGQLPAQPSLPQLELLGDRPGRLVERSGVGLARLDEHGGTGRRRRGA